MSSSELRAAIVGAGRMGRDHAENLSSITGVRVVAIVDPNDEAAHSLAGNTGAEPFARIEDLAAVGALDIGVICAPPTQRGDAERWLAERGTHLLIEKPVARTSEQGRALLADIESSGVLVSVGYLYRYIPAAEKLLELFADIPPALVIATWMHSRPPIAWLRSKELGGGQLVDQTTHLLDLMRYVIGEPSTVYAQASRGLFPEELDFTGDDASSCTVTFERSTVAAVASTYALFHAEHTDHGPRMNWAGKGIHAEMKDFDLRVITPEGTEEYCPKEPPMLVQDRAFVEAVRRGNDQGIMSSFEDGLRTLELTLAANRSIDTGEIVRLG